MREATPTPGDQSLVVALATLEGPRGPMRLRRRTVEHPFGTIKVWIGHAHFLTRTLPRAQTEMRLRVLADNLMRVINLFGTEPLLKAMMA